MGLISTGLPETHVSTSGFLASVLVEEMPPGIQDGDGLGIFIAFMHDAEDDWNVSIEPFEEGLTNFRLYESGLFYGARYGSHSFAIGPEDLPITISLRLQAAQDQPPDPALISRMTVVTQMFAYHAGSIDVVLSNNPFDVDGSVSAGEYQRKAFDPHHLVLFTNKNGGLPTISGLTGGWNALTGVGSGADEDLGFRLVENRNPSLAYNGDTYPRMNGATLPNIAVHFMAHEPMQFSPTMPLRCAAVYKAGQTRPEWLISANRAARFTGRSLSSAENMPGTERNLESWDSDAWLGGIFQAADQEQWHQAVATGEGTQSGSWRHIVLTKNGTSQIMQLYIDGVSVASSYSAEVEGTRSSNQNGPLVIGGGPDQWSDWEGRISHLAFYTTELSSFAIINHAASGLVSEGGNASDYELQVLSDQPVGYWKMGDASGSLVDSSGNSRNASFTEGSPLYQQEDPWGGTDAVGFNGSTFFSVADHNDWSSASFSVEGWFFVDGEQRGGGPLVDLPLPARSQIIVWPTNTPPPGRNRIEYVEVRNLVINGSNYASGVACNLICPSATLNASGTSTSGDWSFTQVRSGVLVQYTGSRTGPSSAPTTIRLTPENPIGDEILCIAVTADDDDGNSVPASITFDSIVWSWI